MNGRGVVGVIGNGARLYFNTDLYVCACEY